MPPPEPIGGFFRISGNAKTVLVDEGEVELREDVLLGGAQNVPVAGLVQVLLDAAPVAIDVAERAVGDREARFSAPAR